MTGGIKPGDLQLKQTMYEDIESINCQFGGYICRCPYEGFLLNGVATVTCMAGGSDIRSLSVGALAYSI